MDHRHFERNGVEFYVGKTPGIIGFSTDKPYAVEVNDWLDEVVPRILGQAKNHRGRQVKRAGNPLDAYENMWKWSEDNKFYMLVDGTVRIEHPQPVLNKYEAHGIIQIVAPGTRYEPEKHGNQSTLIVRGVPRIADSPRTNTFRKLLLEELAAESMPVEHYSHRALLR